MKKKKKIAFVLPDLASGGAERVMSFIAKNISKKEKFEVFLWVAGYSKNTIYNVDDINVTYFNKPRILKAIPNFLFSLIKVRPDIVISSMSHVNTTMGILSFLFPKIKFIGREANVLSIKKQYGTKKRFYNKFPLMQIAYNNLDIILCQSKDMYNDMKLNYNIPNHKLRIINNPITDDFKLKTEKNKKSNKVQFITVARLKKQKGHERLIRAIAKLNFPYQYTIVGDGPEKENLFNLINELGISDNIVHIPYTNEVSKYLAKNDFFLQGSFVEGFPNCLIESCSVGTPIIAYKAPGGLNEIIEEGINGLISDNDEGFIKNIILATSEYQWNAENVSDSVVKKFNKTLILDKYEALFHELSTK